MSRVLDRADQYYGRVLWTTIFVGLVLILAMAAVGC